MHVTFAVNRNNRSALTMAVKLKESASGLLARGLALLYTHADFQPHGEHIPGAMNYMADALSRLSDPFCLRALFLKSWLQFHALTRISATTATSAPLQSDCRWAVQQGWGVGRSFRFRSLSLFLYFSVAHCVK